MEDARSKAFGLIDDWRDEMLGFWEQIVNMESCSREKPLVDQLGELLRQQLLRIGAEVRVCQYERAGNGLVANLGTKTEKPDVCFIGHFDTVFPSGSGRPFRMKDGLAYGPGVLDMKGGVVVQLFAARALREAGYDERRIKLLLAGDEETGHPDSDMDRVIEEECRGAAAAFNFETGDVDGSLVVGRKGTLSCDISAKGVSVHAGREPQNGRSAILELALKIIDLQKLNDYERGMTCNVGRIKGGTARNAVPDFAEIEVDVRAWDAKSLKQMESYVRQIAEKVYVEGVTCTMHSVLGIAPMERSEGNERLFEYVSRVSTQLGLDAPKAVVSGGGSDSAYSTRAGVPSLDQMGVKGRWNHSDREYAVVESLFERTKLAIACVLNLDLFESDGRI